MVGNLRPIEAFDPARDLFSFSIIVRKQKNAEVNQQKGFRHQDVGKKAQISGEDLFFVFFFWSSP